MMRKKTSFWMILALLLLASWGAEAQSAHRHLRKGNEAYEKQNYSAAELHYRKSLEDKNTSRGSYNLGNAMYQQERYEEAIRRFEHAAQNAQSKDEKASALHNLGNAHFQAEQLDKSIEAYKDALRLRPDDQSTKFNLAQAQRLLKMQQQQQSQQQQKEQQQKGEEQQQQNQAQEGQEQQQNQQEQQGQEQDQQDKQNNQQKQNQPRESQGGEGQTLSADEAQRLLDIIQQEELKVMEKMKREAKGAAGKRAKDW
jgi:Ca-activated chloride channel homolog